MALLRTFFGLLAVIALTVAPACALSAAPFGAPAHAAHGAAEPPQSHCAAAGEEAPSEAARALCAFFCGYFLAPAPVLFLADFEAPPYDSFAATLSGGDLRPPAPPPRA